MSFWTATLTLFLVLDPLGNVPVWVTLLRDVPAERRLRVIYRECLIALGVLVVFLFAGPGLMTLLAVEGPALQLAGGVVIFVIAMRMIFPRPGGIFGDEAMRGEPFIVPLAVPLLAGPSAMATVMLIGTAHDTPASVYLSALFAAWLATLLILLLAPTIERLLGQRMLIATERLFGMLLTVIAIQLILSGIDAYVATRAA